MPIVGRRSDGLIDAGLYDDMSRERNDGRLDVKPAEVGQRA